MIVALISIIIKLYKFYRYSYLFNVSVETFTSVNGNSILTYFKFTNIFSSSYVKWRSDRSFYKMINAVVHVIYNDKTFINQFLNRKLTLTIFEVNRNNILVALADPVTFKYNDLVSAKLLLNSIRWNSIVANKDNDITIIIKLS